MPMPTRFVSGLLCFCTAGASFAHHGAAHTDAFGKHASGIHLIQAQPAPAPVAPTTPNQSSDDERAWSEAIRQGREAMQQGNANRAIRSFEAALDLADTAFKDYQRTAISASMLGDAYMNQGVYEDAVDAYARTVSVLTNQLGAKHAAVGEPAMKLGRTQLFLNRHKEARDSLEQAIECLAKPSREQLPPLVLAHRFLLFTLARLDDPRAAAEAADRAIEDLNDKLKDSYSGWGEFYNLQGYNWSLLTDEDPSAIPKTADAFDRSVRWHEAHATPDDGGYTEALLGLARAAHDAGQLEEASDAYQKSIERLKATNDDNSSVRLAYTWAGLAAVHQDQHRRVDAIEAMYQSVDAAARQDSIDPINRLTAALGADLRMADLANDAVDTLQAQIQTADKTAPSYGLLVAELGRALGHRGADDDRQEAEAQFKSATSLLRAAGPDFAASAAWAQVAHAGLLVDTGQFDEAAEIISRAIDWAQSLGPDEGGDQTKQIIISLNPMLITARNLSGQTGLAVSLARKHLKQIGRLHGERSPQAASARAQLAGTLADAGDQQASLATYQEALALLAPLGEAGKSSRGWIQFSYARELFNDGQYQAALPVVQQAFATDPQDYIAFYLACCQLRLGQVDEAQQTLTDWAQARHPEPGVDWPSLILALLRGEKSSDELAQIARKQGGYTQTRWMCEMYFYLAIKTIAEGHDRAAIKYLKACRDQNVYQFVEWESARRMLARLEAG